MHKILIVEDEAAAAMHLRKYLENEGYQIVGQAFTGAQAVEKARSAKPELILMDIVLQGDMNGIEASEIIVSELNIPILFISAYSDESIVSRAASVNPYGYILKPFQENQIKVAVEVAFRKIASDHELHESREVYHQMVQRTNEAMVVIQDGIIATANQKSVELFGYPLEEMISRRFLEYFHADDREMVGGGYAGPLIGQETSRVYSCRITDQKGNGRWVELSFIPMQWAGRPAVLSLLSDITGRKLVSEEANKYKTHLEKLVEERTEMLLKTSGKLQKEIELRKHAESQQEIATEVLRIGRSTPYIDEMLEKLAILLKDWSQIETVSVRLDGHTQYPDTGAPATPRRRRGASGRGGAPTREANDDAAFDSLRGDIVSGRFDPSKPYFTDAGSFWTNNITELSEQAGLEQAVKRYIGMGYVSVALIPLRSEGITYGLIGLNDSKKDRFAPKLISLFEGLAELIAGAIAQKLSLDPGGQSAEKWRALFDNSRDVVCVVSQDGRFVDINAAAEGLLGYTRDELLALHLKDIYRTPADSELFQKEIEAKGFVTGFAATLKRKDGTPVDCLITAHVIKDAYGNATRHQAIIRERAPGEAKAGPSVPSGRLVVADEKRREIEPASTFRNIISRNARMLAIFKMLPQIAQSDSTVLIEGKSGTGKELLARAIHDLSKRRRGPFVAINCAALPENLLESELFGYVKGAFTNAVGDKPGRFALAEKGTILLDEIAELSPLLQVKLLRVIQEKEIEPLGGIRSVKIDVRIISATNRNIADEVRKSHFREDLFFRLNVVRIELPELKDRREDIPLLITHILRKVSTKIGSETLYISDDATEFLMKYDYPGNIRELENIIESAAVLCTENTITLETIVNKLFSNTRSPQSDDPVLIKDAVTNAEKKLIEETLTRTGGDRGKTAALLSMDKSTLWRKMKKYGLS